MRLTPRDASHAATISHTIKRVRPEALNERPANNQIAGPRDSRSFRMPPMSASEAMISDTPLPAQMTEAATPTIPSEPGATTRPRSEAITDGPVHPPCEMGDTTTRLPPAQSTDILVPCREPFPSAWTNIQDGPEGIPGRSSTLRTAPRDPPIGGRMCHADFFTGAGAKTTFWASCSEGERDPQPDTSNATKR